MVKTFSNYFAKMFTLFLGLTVIIGMQTTGVGYANSGVPALTVVKTVSGGGTTLAIGVDGNIHRENPDKSWSVVYTGFRNGASDLVYANNRFYATSFFQGAHSTNGNSWTTFTLPLGERFNPGNILPDSKVFTRTQMSVNQIQDFLNRMGGECRSGYVCLKDYRETTYDRAANVMCREYKGARNETAAQIIHKVSQACNVSAEVLIVMLQKEQGLVTHTWPSQTRYNIAMGYACPDTAPCDSLFFGFYNQVYNAARQLVRYSNPPGTSNFFTWYPVGRTTTVRWHPNVSCGGSPVFIENQATASFYYYTPYQPNTAALVAFSAVGDSCSAYGNRNLWRLYHQWFNSDAKYNTFVAHNGRVFVSVDMDGTVAISSNGTSWVREPSTPVKTNEKVSNFYADGGTFIIALTNGRGYSSTNGVSWSSFSNPQQRPAEFVVGIEGAEPPAVETPSQPQQPNETTRVVTTVVDYTVARGDTVWGIAGRFRTTVNRIVELNSLPNGGALIFVGQRLKVETTEIIVETTPAPPTVEVPAEPAPPVIEVPAEPTPAPTPEPTPPVVEVPRETTQTPASNVETRTHTVARGDTVWSIARQYSTTVANIVSINNLRNGGALIFVGQRLTISGAPTNAPPTVVAPAPATPVGSTNYTVKAGDTLWRIANMHNTSVTWLASNNNIRNVNLIRPGMVLTVR